MNHFSLLNDPSQGSQIITFSDSRCSTPRPAAVQSKARPSGLSSVSGGSIWAHLVTSRRRPKHTTRRRWPRNKRGDPTYDQFRLLTRRQAPYSPPLPDHHLHMPEPSRQWHFFIVQPPVELDDWSWNHHSNPVARNSVSDGSTLLLEDGSILPPERRSRFEKARGGCP